MKAQSMVGKFCCVSQVFLNLPLYCVLSEKSLSYYRKHD